MKKKVYFCFFTVLLTFLVRYWFKGVVFFLSQTVNLFRSNETRDCRGEKEGGWLEQRFHRHSEPDLRTNDWIIECRNFHISRWCHQLELFFSLQREAVQFLICGFRSSLGVDRNPRRRPSLTKSCSCWWADCILTSKVTPFMFCTIAQISHLSSVI